MATRVTFVSGTAEVKRREKPVEEPMVMASSAHVLGDRGYVRDLPKAGKGRSVVVEEEVLVARTGYVTGDRGNPHHIVVLDETGEGGVDSVPPAQSVSYVDGKCSCCPYGYHIDLDFLNFCRNVADGSTLHDLKRIQRTKRKLRKSMEVMLHQQQHGNHDDSATASLAPASAPPDVVHSTEASRLINMVQYEQSATHRVLRDIDSSVSAKLSTMEGYPSGPPGRGQQRHLSSDSEDSYSYSPVSPISAASFTVVQQQQQQQHFQQRFNTLPQAAPPPPVRQSSLHHHHHHHHSHHHHSNGEESSHLATSLSTSGRTDSMSSLSSVSTVSSEQVTGAGLYTSTAVGMLTQPHDAATAQVRRQYHSTTATAMTAEKLAATMATHFPEQGRGPAAESPTSPMSPDTTIGKASLAAIRESMSVSLQRLRDLEEQVKAIPILQVRISVLKEEKRLLALQLKAKQGGATVRSVGVGQEVGDFPPEPLSPFLFPSSASTPRSPRSPGPPTLPKPARGVRTVGVGEHSVLEPYLLRPDLPTGYTVTHNEVQTDIRSLMQERETLTVDRERRLLMATEDTVDAQLASPVQTHFTINQIQRGSPRAMTRSIGVGEGNVHDSSLQIHEKELRTVIIGGNNGTVAKRNVGVEVRVPTRSVGVSYSCDEARPSTRTVGVNVTCDTSSILTSLDFRGETELRTALRGVLQRNVRSVASGCNFRPVTVDMGSQHEAWQGKVSVGSGGADCHVDVEIRQKVAQRSQGVTARPDTSTHAVTTDKDWVMERGSNTVAVETYNKASATEVKRMGTIATNTQETMQFSQGTQMDVRDLQDWNSIRSVGCNTFAPLTINKGCSTFAPLTYTRGVNTTAKELVNESFDFEISFDSKAINVDRDFHDVGVNTSTKELQLSQSRTECVDVSGEETQGEQVPQRPLTLQEQIIQRGASQASAFLGSTSSSGSLSPTSPGGWSAVSEGGESVRKTVVETVSSSPTVVRQEWTSHSQQAGGGEAVVKSEVFRTSGSSGGGGVALTSRDLDSADGSGFSRSSVTRTVITGGDREFGGSSSSSGSSSTNTSSSKTITKTMTLSGGGGGGSSENKVSSSTVTTTSGGVSGGGGLSMGDGYSQTGRGMSGFSDLKGGSSYLERFGFGARSDLSSITEGASSVTQTSVVSSSSSGGDVGGGGSGGGVEISHGTASLDSGHSSPQNVVLMGGEQSAPHTSSSSSSTSSSSSGQKGGQSVTTETVVVKRSSSGGNGSRLSKHRYSDGARISRELDVKGGIYSGRRVGSVEDFMPDDMRRLMNIETSGSGRAGAKGKGRSSRSQGAGNVDLMVTKTTRTVTTKRTFKDGSVSATTETTTDPDISVTTVSKDGGSDLDFCPEGQGQGLGKLSMGQFDLSKIDDEEDSGQDHSESGGIKDSGYYDSSSMSVMSQSSGWQGSEGSGSELDAMGSLERRQLKSIMKKSRTEAEDPEHPKRGISFAESVVGGTGSSSEEEEGATESDDSTTSFEEGSYDGREGDIVYQCRDDEAIAQGLPGAKMYDQNIRETYELGEEMRKSCQVLASYLVDSTTIQTKELNANLRVVQEEWFRVSSHKLSSGHQVEDYLSSIKEISARLLEYIVNLVDNNGNAAIHYCVSHCNFDIVSLLLDTEVCDVKRPNKAGFTPTMLASLAQVQNHDHRDIIRRLFATGNINAAAEQTGQTALMLAVSQSRADMVELLLQEGAGCNLQDFDGSTALMCACEHGHAPIVQLLLAQPDCDANLTDNENSTALSIAMEAGHKDIGVILYKHLNFSKPASPAPGAIADPQPALEQQVTAAQGNCPETEV